MNLTRRRLLILGGGLGVAAALPVGLGTLPAARATSGGYTWGSVAIGGGGYVTGLVAHPAEPDLVYLRTDVGGAYRWDPAGQRWLPIADFFPFEDRNLQGIESLAVDPSNPDVVYIAAGAGNRGGPSATPQDVYRSANRGATWQATGLPVGMWGNGDYRWAGERLAVHPTNSNIVHFASRQDGLWRTTNGAQSWHQVTSFPTTGTLWGGLPFVLFNPSGHIYVGAWDSGVYRSTNGGSSWTLLSGGPARPVRAALASDGTLYVSHTSGVAKFLPAGSWVDITPGPGEFSGVSVHPSNSNVVMAAVRAPDNQNPIYRSTNGGSSWSQVSFARAPDVPWWPDSWFASATASLVIDPHTPQRVWLTDWFGTWRTDNITASPSVWYTREEGHEEVVVFDLVSPPAGAPLWSGVADVTGFRHPSVTEFPDRADKLTGIQDIVSLDFCEAQPHRFAAVGRNRGGQAAGGFRVDAAATEVELAAFPSLPFANARDGKVAVSASNPDRIVWMPRDAIPYTTGNGGASWQAATGAPAVAAVSHNEWAPNQPLAADRVNGNNFYLYAYGTGGFYRSTNGGQSYTQVATLPSLPTVFDRHFVKVSPCAAGHVWVSLDFNGLYRSTNGGSSFAQIGNVSRSFLFALGHPPPGAGHPALFVFGTIAGQGDGIFRSDDLGVTWTRIDTFPDPYIGANVRLMEGDRQVFGRVYVGTGGRGIYLGEPVDGGDPSPGPHPITGLAVGTEQAPYPAANAIDGNPATRWASWNGLPGAWVRYDLGQPRTVTELRLMLYKGATRTYPVVVEAGPTPSSLTPVWSGTTALAGGLQGIGFGPVSARYVRVAMTGPHSNGANVLSIHQSEVIGPG